MVLLWILWSQISKSNLDFSHFVPIFSSAFQKHYFLFLVSISLLLPNYALEAARWRNLSAIIQKKNMRSALQDVLLGLSASVFTPFMLGDFVGRSLSFSKENKMGAMALNGFSSICQTFVALCLGFWALLVWKFIGIGPFLPIFNVLLLALGCACFLGLWLLFSKFSLSSSSSNYIWKRFLLPFAQGFAQIPIITRFEVLLLTFFRSFVYNLQYLLFYVAFGITVDKVLLLIGINFLLLVKTVGGGLNLIGDLTLRQVVGIYFFVPLGVPVYLIIASNLFIWLINIFLPVFFSAIFIRDMK
jgi:hypothetical protein